MFTQQAHLYHAEIEEEGRGFPPTPLQSFSPLTGQILDSRRHAPRKTPPPLTAAGCRRTAGQINAACRKRLLDIKCPIFVHSDGQGKWLMMVLITGLS